MAKTKFNESQLQKIGLALEKINLSTVISIVSMELDEDSVIVSSLVDIKEISDEMQRSQIPKKEN